jgi:lysophospholipase L1-like esterase
MESCARVLITARNDLSGGSTNADAPSGFVLSGDLGWERRPGFEGESAGGIIRAFDSEGFKAHDTVQVADRRTPHVLAIGDSVTFGWGVPPESSFVEVVDRALPNASVINLALSGYSSFQGYRSLVRYGDRFRPAAILASFNFNDRRAVPAPDVDSAARFARLAEGGRPSRMAMTMATVADTLYLARGLRSVLRHVGAIPDERLIDIRDLEARVPPESYRDNLRKIAKYGRARGVPVIFLLLKDNPAYGAVLREGVHSLEAGDLDRAVRAFRTAMSLGPYYPELSRKYLVEAYRRMANTEAVDATAPIPPPANTLDGGPPYYLDTDYNAIMIEVAREFDLAVIDARPALDADPLVFFDICHPDARGHERIAARVLEAFGELLPALFEEPGARASAGP